MTDSDPWSSVQHINGDNSAPNEFEDSFIGAENNNSHEEENISSNSNNQEHQPLPDSLTYLKGLERKLDRLKKNSKLVDALSEKRDDCLRALVQNDLSGSGCNNELLLDLEASIVNSESAVINNLYRQLQPVQPVTVGETVHIVKYDQLEEQRLELESAEEEESPASR